MPKGCWWHFPGDLLNTDLSYTLKRHDSLISDDRQKKVNPREDRVRLISWDLPIIGEGLDMGATL
jgi:hypothetical protein